jgi:eukaryotic-like serine/threonine-protein kinase
MADPPEKDTGPAEPKRIQPGDVLAGKYRIEKVLGEGGMGQVFEATHIDLDQRVAVKALIPRMVTQEEAVARFTREAKGLAKLNSEHVARVFDVGKVPDGPPYMVMELLEGKDVGELVDARGALPIEEATELALHACAGLAEVHASGIIHRDLKPSNCFVVTRGDGTPCLKLLDFGISKFRGTAVTRTAAIMGSPGYMSPEQMASTKDVDERADIWALGATYYEMLTGRPAFVAENAPMLCIKIASESPDPPRGVRADIPEALEAVLLKCLAKATEGRYRSVAEVARAIAPFAPERARGYVEKIDGILRGARVTPASDRPPAPNVFERPTVRAGDDAAPAKKAPSDDRETVAPAKRRLAAAGGATAEPPPT